MPKKRSHDFDVLVGARLAHIRKTNGVSQGEMAKILSDMGDGVSYQQIQKYESGFNRFPLFTVYNFSKVFGIDIGKILSDALDPQKNASCEVICREGEDIISKFNQIPTLQGKALAVGIMSLIEKIESKRK